MNLALLGRRDRPRLSRSIVAGAIAPDLAIAAFYLWERFMRGASEQAIWTARYFNEGWQAIFDLAHSIPVAAAGAVVSIGSGSAGAVMFFVSMILHDLCDLPLHHDDGHRHFYPFSNWRFASPVSYWDPRHHGAFAALAEVIVVAASIVIVWRRQPGAWTRVALAAVGLLYAVGWAALYLSGAI